MHVFTNILNARALLKIFVLFAFLISPAIEPGDALAAARAHETQMMTTGHCQSQVSHTDGRRQTEMNCCAAPWIGIAAEINSQVQAAKVCALQQPIPLAAIHRAFLGELATPPPRSSL